MSNAWQKTGRFSAWALVALLGLVGLLLVLLQTPVAKDRLRREIVQRANEALEGRVSIDELSGTLLWSARLDGIELYDGRGALMARVESVEADYSLMSLLWGRLSIGEATISEPRVALRRYEDGTLNTATLVAPSDEPPSTEPPSEFGVVIGSYAIEGGTVIWEDRPTLAELPDNKPNFDTLRERVESTLRGPKRDADQAPSTRLVEFMDAHPAPPTTPPGLVMLTGLELDGDLRMRGALDIRARLESLEFDAKSHTIVPTWGGRLTELSAHYTPERLEATLGTFALEGLSIGQTEATFGLPGEREEASAGPFHASIGKFAVERETLEEVLPDLNVQTSVSGSLEAGGQFDDLLARADIAFEEAGRIGASGRLDLTGERPVYRAHVRLEDVEPLGIADLGQPPATVHGALAVQGRGFTPETADVSLKSALWSTSVSNVDIRQFLAVASVRDQKVRLEQLHLDSSHLKADARGSLGLDGAFDLRAETKTPDKKLDTDKLGVSGLPSIKLGRADINVDADGKLDFEASTPFDLVEEIDLDARWRLAGIDLIGLRVSGSNGDIDFEAIPAGGDDRRSDVTLNARVDGSGVSIPGLRLRRGQFEAQGSGRIDLEADDPFEALESWESTFSVDVDGVRVGDSMSAGTARLSGELRQKGRRAAFGSNVTLTAGKLAAFGFRVDEWSARLDTTAELSRAATLYPIARLDVQGKSSIERVEHDTVGLDRADVTIDIDGPPLDPVGRVTVDMQQLSAAGIGFSTVNLSVDAKENRSVQLDLRAQPNDPEARPVVFMTATTYSAAFDAFDISALRLGRPGQIWELESPTKIGLGANEVRVEEFDLRNGPQRLFADGVYRMDGEQSIDLAIEKLDLKELQRLADYQPIPDLSGTVGLNVGLRGTTRAPSVELSFDAADVTAMSYGPLTASLRANSDGSGVRLESLTATLFGRPLLEGHATVPIDWDLTGKAAFRAEETIKAHAELKAIAFRDIRENVPQVASLPVTGRASGVFDFEGTIDKPSFDTSVTVEDVSVHGEFAGTRIDIDKLGSNTTLHYGRYAKGKKRIEFQSRVTWADAQLVSAAFMTDAPIVELGLSYSSGEISLLDFIARASRTPIQFAFALEETNLADIPLGVFQDADAEGVLHGKVDFEGTLLRPTVDLDFGLSDFGWNQYRDIFLDLYADLSDGELRLEKMRLEWDAKEILVAYGHLPFPIEAIVEGQSLQNLPIDFTVDIKPTSMSMLGAIDYAFNRFQGTFAGYIRAQGTLRSPDVETRVAITDALFSKEKRGSIAVWLKADDRSADGGVMFCQEDRPILTGQFDVPVNFNLIELAAGERPLADGTISASLKGKNVPIKQLFPTAFVDDYIADPAGYLHVDLELSGSWEKVEARGNIELEDGGVTLVEYGRRFDEINLVSALTPEKVELSKFTMTDSNGAVKANGTVGLDNFVPQDFDFYVQTDEFDAGSLAAGFSALVTSKVDLKGKIGDPRIDADVKVKELNVEMPETEQRGTHATTLSEDIVVIEEYGDKDSTDQVDDFLSQGTTAPGVLQARVNVDIERDSFVRHPNGYLNFAANLTADIQGTRTLVSGQIDAIRGDFEFLGRDFRVDRKEGIVRFTGANPPNPKLDIVAIHPLDRSVVADLDSSARKNPRVFVRVTGSAYEPRLDMTSEPSMSESEIIFVLMTGRPPSKTDVGQEEGVASQAAAAAGGIFSALIQQKISKTLPVDVFRFESGKGGLAGSQLRVGKYLTSDLFISYAYKFGADDEDSGYEARVEYHFLPSWMIEARYGENQTGGLNIFWDIY